MPTAALNSRIKWDWFGGETGLQTQFPAIRVMHDQRVVVDKRRITANGGLVRYQAALVLLGGITTAAHARVVYESLGMDRLSPWADMQATIS